MPPSSQGVFVMSLRSKSVWGLVCALAISPAALNADEVSFSDTVPLTQTNWKKTVTLPKFDPSLGTLTSVLLKLTGEVSGTASVESKDPSPTMVTATFTADISLMRPDMSVLMAVLPSEAITLPLGSYDGVIDFAGPSGRVLPEVKKELFESHYMASPLSLPDQSLFVGAGEFMSLPVWAVGRSRGSGSGNLVMLLHTDAAATAEVTYFFQPIPEPSVAGAMLLGMLMIHRRRRSA